MHKLVQRSLMTQGYLGEQGTQLAENSPEFVAVLGKFQADSGMVVSGVVDFPTYERTLRNFVALNQDGKLVQVGWTPTNASPLSSAAAGGQRPVLASPLRASGLSGC